MKRIIPHLMLLFSILLIGSFTELAAQESYYTLDVKSVAPKSIKFINNTNMTLKLILYKGKDKVMAAGIKTLTIKPKKTASYKMGVYNVKIYKSQLLDKRLATKKNVSGNLRMSGSERKFSAVRLTARKKTEFKNNTGEKIKICLYNKSDMAKMIPFQTYMLEDNTSTAVYSGDKSSFFVSVFDPGVLDKLLVSQICPDQSIITVSKIN